MSKIIPGPHYQVMDPWLKGSNICAEIQGDIASCHRNPNGGGRSITRIGINEIFRVINILGI
jgi:hypothetical protein